MSTYKIIPSGLESRDPRWAGATRCRLRTRRSIGVGFRKPIRRSGLSPTWLGCSSGLARLSFAGHGLRGKASRGETRNGAGILFLRIPHELFGEGSGFFRNKWVWRLLGFCYAHFAGVEDEDIEYLRAMASLVKTLLGNGSNPLPISTSCLLEPGQSTRALITT